MKATFCRELNALRPVGEEAEAGLSKIPAGDVVMVEIKRPRNMGHHRKWHALLDLVFDNQERYPNKEALSAAIKCGVGHCDVYPMANGEGMVMVPKSTAFTAMEQGDFEAFYDRAVNLIISKIIPGLTRESLLDEVEAILAGRG